jgi:N-carbamoylputrescine amidase
LGGNSAQPRRGERLLRGGSQPDWVADTNGQILGKAGVSGEEILLVPVDPGNVDVTRTHWPFLRDRRIDAYGDLTKRFID